MVITVFNFKNFVVLVIILLLSQQSFAAFITMNCNNMKDVSVVLQEHNTDMTSQMHDHNSQSKDTKAHEKCDVCDSSDCNCGKMSRCINSAISTTPQTINHEYTLYLDHGKRFISEDEYPGSGVYLHPFRPPIFI